MLYGTLIGITGFMLTARVASGKPNPGAALALDSIAVAVIGAILIAFVRNGMDLINVRSYLQIVVMGCLLIFAVAMDQFRFLIKDR